MKQNKRFFLVALALMVATCLFAGIAMAETVTIKISQINTDPAGTVTLKLDDPVAIHYTGTTKWIRLADYFFTPDFDTTGITYKNGTTYEAEQIKWTISDTSYGTLTTPFSNIGDTIKIYDGDATQGPDSTGKLYEYVDLDVDCPRLYLTDKTGEFTVTASNQADTIKKTFTFKLEAAAEAVKNPITALTFTQDSYTIKLGKDALNNLSNYVTATYKEDPDVVGYEGYSWSWSSSNKAVVTVNDAGVVTPKKVGEAEITLTVKNLISGGEPVTATATVKVVDNPVKSFRFEPSTYELDVGAPLKWANLKNTIIPDPLDADFNPDEEGVLSFVSSDPSVVMVSDDGSILLAVGPGDATITVTLFNKITKDYQYATITVKVAESPVDGIEFKPDEFKVMTTDSINLKKYVRFTPDKEVTSYDEDDLFWTSSDITIATVDQNGNVTGVAPGDVIITATIYNKVAKKPVSGTCKVKVLNSGIPLDSVSFTQDEFKMVVGEEEALKNYLDRQPGDWTDSDLIYTFTTSDYSVARVSKSTGYVYAVGVGEATITLSIYNENYDTTLTATTKIKVAPPVEATGVTFAPKSLTLNKGDAVKIGTQLNSENYIVVTPADAAGYYDLTLTSSDEEIVTVDYDDINDYWHIHGDNVGTATVTATVYNRVAKTYVTATLEVKVEENIPLKGFTFKKESYTLKLNRKTQIELLNQIVKDPVNAILDENMILWESSDLQVAEVVGGTVIAKNPGTATITAKLVDKDDKVLLTAKTEIKAVPITIEKVALDKKEARLAFYATGNRDYNTSMVATVVMQPANGYYKRIEWQSSDAGVAVVSTEKSDLYINGPISSSIPDGCAYIKATGLGEAIITVDVYTVDDAGNEVKRTATMNVLVSEKLVQLKLNVAKRTLYLKKGEEVTFQLEATDKSNDELVPVRWTSSAPKIAKVDRDGVVTALKAGKAVITATTKDGNKTTATATVTVKKLKVTKVTVAKTLKMKVGDIITPTITVKPATAFNTALKFKSSNAKVVSVSADGEFTALKAGKAVITITAADGSKKSAKITVTVTK